MKPFVFYNLSLISLFFLKVTASLASQIDDDLNAEKITIVFDEFVKKFSKTYPTPTEQRDALSAFSDNLLRIRELNKEFQSQDITFGINQYTDLTDYQFFQKVTNFGAEAPQPAFQKTNENPEKQEFSDGLPGFLDWRTRKNTVGSVRDQGPTDCGWAFAISAVVQSVNSFKTIELVQPSESLICQCVDSNESLKDKLNWLQNAGVPLESQHIDTCDWSDKIPIYRINELSSNSAVTLQRSLISQGPLVVQFKVGSSFRHYQSGIFNSTDCKNSETFDGSWHQATLVGYGTSYNVPYWLLKNSWGTEFGENGYFRVIRGIDWCGIESKEAYSVEI